jgi:2-polyprenyl-3-methyl-5-hydroxy-6-metoxy-1,4-benzoquinol methylase
MITATTAARPLSDASAMTGERTACCVCRKEFDPARVESATVPSNVRAFRHETFNIWRCPDCRALHTREVVNLERYYTNYPLLKTLNDPARKAMSNSVRRLIEHGLSPDSALLDYGCGWGLFLEYLRELGYANARGYDPYSAVEAFHNPASLEPGTFDFIVLQDVVEHVEDLRVLFRELDAYLKPGGSVFVGTPCADGISLAKPMDYWLQLHPPYHLHIYSQAALVQLAAEQGWTAVDVHRRPFYETKQLGMNSRAVRKYQAFSDGTLDAFTEPVPIDRLRRSVRWRLWARFGYWFTLGAEMTMLFRKTGAPAAQAGGR